MFIPFTFCKTFGFTNVTGITRTTSLHITHKTQNKDIVVAKVDKDSSIVIMKTSYCVAKLDTMINDGTIKGTCIETTDNTIKELFKFKDFLHRNFIIMNDIKI